MVSAKRPERGRGRDEAESLEDGRCCHESVPERESDAGLLLVGVVVAEPLEGEGGSGRGRSSTFARSLKEEDQPSIEEGTCEIGG